MADLARTQRRDWNIPYDFKDTSPTEGWQNASVAHRRTGAGGKRGGRRKTADGVVMWWLLAAAASILILAMGIVLGFRMTAPAGSPVRSADSAAAQATLPTATLATAPRPTGQGAAPMATKVASILGTPATPAAAPAAPGQPAGAAVPDQPAAGFVPAERVASSAPTAADFSRPAFLEPVSGDEADLPESATETVADDTAIADAPLPPVKEPPPAAADDGQTARIRSAVTLRSGPRRSASAIGTLEAGAKVTLYSCKAWCEVSSGDKRGYVYRAAVAQ